MGGLQAPVKCVCVRSQSTLGLRMADQVQRHAACLGTHTHAHEHTLACARVLSCWGMVCVLVQTEQGPDTAVFGTLVSQGTPKARPCLGRRERTENGLCQREKPARIPQWSSVTGVVSLFVGYSAFARQRVHRHAPLTISPRTSSSALRACRSSPRIGFD
jgi:hypothetical protein